MKALSDKIILLTGANGGFGREYIKLLLVEGAKLVLTSRDVVSLKSYVNDVCRVNNTGSILAVVQGDVSSPDGCEALFKKRKEVSPYIDVLINNAGILSYGLFHETPVNECLKVIQVNLSSTMHLTSLFLPDMLARGDGHIVFMSSLGGFIPTAYETAYSVSKFGVRAFGMALHKELSGKGIVVTNVYPTWSDTGMLNSPSYGSARTKKPSSFLIVDPKKIIKAAVKGIKKRKLHVYADPFTKLLWWVNKITPLVAEQPHD